MAEADDEALPDFAFSAETAEEAKSAFEDFTEAEAAVALAADQHQAARPGRRTGRGVQRHAGPARVAAQRLRSSVADGARARR